MKRKKCWRRHGVISHFLASTRLLAPWTGQGGVSTPQSMDTLAKPDRHMWAAFSGDVVRVGGYERQGDETADSIVVG